MTATATEPTPEAPVFERSARDRRAAAVDVGFRVLALLAGLSVLAILALIAISTAQKGWPAFSGKYFFGTHWVPAKDQFGILPLVYGTVIVALIAVVFGVPVSIGIALFITEVMPRRLRSWAVTAMDLLAAVPSIVLGLWGFRILVPHIRGFLNGTIHGSLGKIPGLGRLFGPSTGVGYMTAGIVVALMITPIITAVTREVFNTVPRNDKEGALALGATRWEMIKGVVLPHSSGGITGAVMLGLGRALGETIAVALLIGANPRIAANLLGTGQTMPSEIALNLQEASGKYQPALIGLGVVLFVVTIAVNVSARKLVVVVDRRLQGAA